MPALDFLMPAHPTPLFYGASDAVFEVMLHEPPNALPQVPEALVQEIWQAQRFDTSALTTSSGESITMLDPGTLNTDSGPDFSNARLRIGETEWVGDIEIHTTSGGWFDHQHHLDAAYDRVILHVALHADIWTGGLLRPDGSTLPELILYPHLGAPLRHLLYQFYTRRDNDILCAGNWHEVPEATITTWIRTLAAERMRAKKDRLADMYLLAPDLEALLHERLFAALGYAKNDEAMTVLARHLPRSLLRSITEPLDLEALHLGVAGLLPEPADLLDSDRASADYAMALRDRFDQLQLRFEVPVMDKKLWRFFRLRPANFPPLRIAQAVAMLHPGGILHRDPIGRLVEALAAEHPVAALRDVLRATPGPFWETHIRLEKATRPRNPAIGTARLNALLANAVVPVLLLYAEQTSNPVLEQALFDVLRHLPPERDAITRRFEELDYKVRDAFMAQGLHQLYRTRCREARCLSCPIGRCVLDKAP